jgi:hypothetical protein
LLGSAAAALSQAGESVRGARVASKGAVELPPVHGLHGAFLFLCVCGCALHLLQRFRRPRLRRTRLPAPLRKPPAVELQDHEPLARAPRRA